MTLKSAFIGVVMLAFAGCDSANDSTKMSKYMDEWWEEQAENLEKVDSNASSKEVFINNAENLNTKIAFYSCVPFDKDKINNAEFKKCADIALRPLGEIYAFCEKQNSQVEKDKLFENKNFQKCMLDEREKLAATARKLARYKYDSEFDKKSINDKDLAIFASGIEGEVSQMGTLDSKIGKADKEQVKVVAQKLTAKAADNALQAYAADTQNKPFGKWLDEYAYKLRSAAKKPTESCIQAKCGEMPADLPGLIMAAAMPYAFVGAFASGKERREMESKMEVAVISVVLNHPWGKCMIKNETQCQLKFIDEYKFEPTAQGK